ncbi:phosphate transport system substrate-binding protein [Bacilli bacterium PM5-3]|nr:phosphate transport system substrate-binding protein [Bacilli bacterium PM5-3]MDH6603473.1 phosphate transport system substrate-binding protein [Bacilli bacterium PM5-9]
MKKIISLLIFLSFGLMSCSQKAEMEVSGSTSVAPLMNEIIFKYQKDHDMKINLTADGSSAGIKAVANNISNIGMSSRELNDEEKKLNLNSYVIALDAIGVIVNKDNGVNNISLQQLHDIYSGKITNWQDVGGKNLPIRVISREDGSGTRDAFEETVSLLNENKTSEVAKTKAIIVNSSGAILENVIQKKGAIGYISLGSANNDIKLLAINNVKPNEENIKAKKYLLSRDFIIVTKKENEIIKQFINYILSDEGQKIVKNNNYIPVK